MADNTDGRDFPEPQFDQFVSKAASRRTFIKGVIASGAAVSASGYLFTLAGCSTNQKSAGGVERLLTLKVNGQMRPVDVLPNETLAMTLRYKLGLTGTKLGCDRGECGACTVHVEGKRVLSCMTLAVLADGKQVTTIEGLARDGKLHPVQAAFVEHDAFQCGFCTPGQIMSAVACIREGHAGSPEEIREFMSGNICRCSAYPQIVAAIQAAVARAQKS